MLLSTLYLLLTTLLVEAQISNYNCPDGWVADLTNRRCYKFVYNPKAPYVVAARACAEWYSTLVSITTGSEHSFLNDYLMSHDGQRNQWYTSGVKTTSSYMWEGEGVAIDRDPTYWINGYQLLRGDRVVYKYDVQQNSFRWTIGTPLESRSYICEISQEEAYRVLIQKRDFTYGTSFLNPENTPQGPIFDPDGLPENVWFLSSSIFLFLECLAIGNPQPQYRWLRGPTIETINEEVKTTSDARYTLTNGKLTIQNPDNTDTQYYRCEASNSQGKIISNHAQLSLGNLGEFSNVADAAVNAYAYEGAQILCSKIYYEPAIVYNWMRVGSNGKSQDIFPSTAPYIFISANGRLYFSEVADADDGKYYCSVSLTGISRSVIGTAQPPSAVSLPITLKINKQAAKGDWGPIFQDDFINVFPNPAVRGQDVRLECFAYGSANSYTENWNFIWSRQGGLPTKVKFQNLNRVLLLENAQAEDEGLYTCLVTRGTEAAQKSFQLTLNTKPYFLMELKHQHIDIGSQFTWQCLADGNPSPEYSWYRNGVKIPVNDPNVNIRSNILVINNADPSKHNGMYQCGAHNILGEVLSSAQLRVLAFAPTFTKNPIPPSLAGAVRGNITITCRPEAAPKPTIKWLKRDRFGNVQELSTPVITGTPQDAGVRIRMTLNGDLVITDIQSADEGIYVCTATNSYGEDQSVCELTVQSGTQLSSKPDPNGYRKMQNETLFIPCEASYDPDLDLVYVWKFNGKMIDMEKESYFFTQSNNPVGLYIKPIQYYHAGKYECTALTPLNSISIVTDVAVLGVPEAPAGLYGDSGRATSNSIQLYWTEGNDRGSPVLEYEVMYNVASEPGEWYPATQDGQRIFAADTLIQDTQVETRKRTYTLTSLLPWNSYKFKIRAKNIKGWGEYSIPSDLLSTQPAAPDIDYHKVTLNLTGGGGSVGDLTIHWNPLPRKYHAAPGMYYRIYWRRDSTQVWTAQNILSTEGDMAKGQLEYVHLVGDENYYLPYFVMIQVNNDKGKGRNSSEVIIYSAEGMPVAAPIVTTCSAVNATAMDVFWSSISNTRQEMKGQIAGFQVNYWVKKSDEDTLPEYKRFIRFNTENGQVPTHGVVIGLIYDSYTQFDVQVFNTAGLGPVSNPYPCETASYPTIHYPTELSVHSIDSSSVKLTWRGVTIVTAEATITGYRIYLWPANENFRNAVEFLANFMPTEYTLSSLERGVVYSVRIAADSSGGEGKKSPTVHFAIAGGATLIDQTVTGFEYLAAPSLSASIVLLVLTSVFVILLS